MINSVASLLRGLSEEKNVKGRQQMLRSFLDAISEENRSCLLGLLLGRKPSRIAKYSQIQEWAMEYSNVDEKMFSACSKMTGDANIAASLIIPIVADAEDPDLYDVFNLLIDLKGKETQEVKDNVFSTWKLLDQNAIVLFNKLLSASFRSPLQVAEVHEFLAGMSGLEPFVISKRLSGEINDSVLETGSLFRSVEAKEEVCAPIKFCSNLIEEKCQRYNPDATYTWYYDGMRLQLVRAGTQVHLWTESGRDLVSVFPELELIIADLPSSFIAEVLLVAVNAGIPSDSSLIQQRIKSKKSKIKVEFYFLDLMKLDGEDLVERSYRERDLLLRKHFRKDKTGLLKFLEVLDINDESTLVQQYTECNSWAAIGLLVRRNDLAYFDVEFSKVFCSAKHRIAATLLYGQRSQGNFKSTYNEFTFGLNSGDEFVPVCRISNIDNDKLLLRLNDIISDHSTERFGPVRSVKPEFVFKISYDSIVESKRHKAGLQLKNAKVIAFAEGVKSMSLNELERKCNEIKTIRENNLRNLRLVK
ncbi:MAG: hypothetical protein HKN22_01355 [Bacteroidia bacterium]|nr:hypothetical protein [Bacteroidia bacterium]